MWLASRCCCWGRLLLLRTPASQRRPLASVCVGLCLGIALSLIVAPFLEDDCGGGGGGGGGGGRGQGSLVLGAWEDDGGVDQQQQHRARDAYEPRILPGQRATLKRQQQQQQQKKKKVVVRPRYYNTELGIKDKLFVGVFSARATLDTFAVAFNRTVHQHVSKLVFFVDGDDRDAPPRARRLADNVVALPSGRAPLLRPFLALAHVGERFARDYDFFFLVPDTTYVRALALRRLADRFGVDSLVYVGRRADAGRGSYCALAPGILLSRATLQRVLAQSEWCAKNAFSDADEDNVGRCVLHSAGVPCAESLQGQEFLSYEMEEGSDVRSQLKTMLRSPGFNASSTVSAVPDAETMYFLHHAFSQLELERLDRNIRSLQASIQSTAHLEPRAKRTWPVGAPPALRVDNRFDVLRWDYFDLDRQYMTSDFSNVDGLAGIHRQDVWETFNESLAFVDRLHGSKRFQFRRFLNGYRRFDPIRGMEYLLDLAFRDKESGQEVRKRIQVVRPLGAVEVVPVPYVTENTRVTMLLVIDAGNHESSVRFLEEYAQACLKNQDNTLLTLVFIYDAYDASKREKDDDVYKKVKALVSVYTHKYSSRGAKVFSINIKYYGAVHLQMGILDLVVKRFSADTLFLLCTVDMEIKGDFLNRVRMNTIRGWQVYAPIPFVQYHPGIVYKDKPVPPKVEVNRSYGHFDAHSYDHFSFYAADYTAGRKLIEKEVPLIRSEKDLGDQRRWSPLSVYQMFVRMQTLHVMRAPEPSLPIHYRFRKCEPTLSHEAYTDCTASRNEGLASRMQLAELVFERERRKGLYVNKNVSSWTSDKLSKKTKL